MNVIIDGTTYVPLRPEVPADERIRNAVRFLTKSQISDDPNALRILAWDALYALAPDLASVGPETAFKIAHEIGRGT